MTSDGDSPPLQVCFVALHAYPAIVPRVDAPVGGTETRAWTFARGLCRFTPLRVSFVVRQLAEPMRDEQEGVRIVPRREPLYLWKESVGHCLERTRRFPGWRVRHWRPSLLWQLPVVALARLIPWRPSDPRQPDRMLRRVKADIYCTFGVNANSARVIASARASGKPSVLMIGSDGDLDERYQPGSGYVSPYGDQADVSHWLISHADAIVVQTEWQRQTLQERFGREATLIANPLDLDEWDRRMQSPLPQSADLVRGATDQIPPEGERFALWVGRAESVHKRPQLLLELARRCPDVSFLMILNPRDPAVEATVRRDRPDNVRIVSTVPVDLMPAVFARAALLVSTSALEGFPNVFLQAAASRIPIASLDIGEEFLTSAACGEFAQGRLVRLAVAVQTLWRDPEAALRLGTSGRNFVETQHALAQQVQQLRHLLESLCGRPSAGG